MPGLRHRCFAEPHRDHPGTTRLFHGDAVERIGHFHGPLVVGDRDELRMVAHLADEARETGDIRLVERRVDFVQHAEGAGLYQEGRKEQGDGRQRPLAAGEQGDALELLAARLGNDLDARFQDVRFVQQDEFRPAAFEQEREHLPELHLDRVERLAEQLLGLAVEFGDGRLQVVDRFVDVVLLRRSADRSAP